MLIAHGPLGYLTAYASQGWWQRSLSKRALVWLYGIAFIGGIFPDSDLFYYYLVNALQGHRQLLTHSLLPYSLLWLLGGLCYRIKRWRIVGVGLILFSLGAFSHLLADSLVGQTNLLAPWSNLLYGLPSFEWYQSSIFMRYSLVTNYTAEFIIIALAGYTFVSTARRLLYLITTGLIGIGVIALLVFIDTHAYKANATMAYADTDRDGILNVQDRDSDGDSILNVDEVLNRVVIKLEQDQMIGSLYDYTSGGLLQIFLRLGFVTDTDLIKRAYGNIGIFFLTEMVQDYATNPQGYLLTPTDYRFSDQVQNWQVWLEHQQRLLPPTALSKAKAFDIMFFQSGHVALYYPETGTYVIDASPSQLYTTIITLQEVEQREGNLVAIGQVIQ